MTNLQDFIKSISFDSERFVSVKNFEGRFWISDFGRVISKNQSQINLLHPHKDQTGYYSLTLRMTPLKRRCRVHQLVGEHFCEMKDELVRMTWNHKDGNKLNNHYLNLEYITAKSNCAHAKETGLCNVKGEGHGQSKLTNDIVIEIFNLRGSELSFSELGRKYNISRRQIGDIINGKAWQHITSLLQ